MSSEAHKILEQALALPANERASLVEALGNSLEGDGESLRPEWITEIERRIVAVESGDSRLIPGDEVEAKILKSLSSD